MLERNYSKTVDAITREIKKYLNTRHADDYTTRDYSFFSGDTGIALFLGHYAQSTGDDESAEVAVGLLDKVINDISTKESLVGHGMFNGFAGVGWVLQHFIINGILSAADGDALNSIDDYVLTLLEKRKDYTDCSYSYGIVGLGVYYREKHLAGDKSARPFLQLILQSIERAAVRDENGIAWIDTIQQIRRPGSPFYNLGLAHGSPGIILFLLSLHNLKIDESGTALLLANEAMQWVMHKAHPTPVTSIFPSMSQSVRVLADKSRLGWCTGDLTVSLAQTKLSKAISSSEYALTAEKLGNYSATRGIVEAMVKADNDLKQFDSTLCHGSTGIGYLFHRLGNQFNNTTMMDASRSWINRTISVQDNSIINSGLFKVYFHYNDTDKEIYWQNSYGLFRGSAGIGLILNSIHSDSNTSWERGLLLDL